MTINTIRFILPEEMDLIGGGETDTAFAGIAPGGCVIHPPKAPAKPKVPSDEATD